MVFAPSCSRALDPSTNFSSPFGVDSVKVLVALSNPTIFPVAESAFGVAGAAAAVFPLVLVWADGPAPATVARRTATLEASTNLRMGPFPPPLTPASGARPSDASPLAQNQQACRGAFAAVTSGNPHRARELVHERGRGGGYRGRAGAPCCGEFAPSALPPDPLVSAGRIHRRRRRGRRCLPRAPDVHREDGERADRRCANHRACRCR